MKQSLIFSICLIALFACNSGSNSSIVENPKKALAVDTLSQYGIDSASHNDVKPISIGRWAPDFKATDNKGNRIHLRQMLKDGPVVIIFYRGYWCPYCTKYLAKFVDQLDEIKSTNARIIAIAPEGEEEQKQTVEKSKGEEIIFISDSNLKIMDLYEVPFKVTDDYNQKIKNYKGQTLEEINGQSEAFLPIPATYIVGTDGKVKWSHFDPNYRNRPSVDEILQTLIELRGI